MNNPADTSLSRRDLIRSLGATTLIAAAPPLRGLAADKDALPMQLYKSLTEEQHTAICLPIDHPKRKYISNWWYICPDQQLHSFFTKDQQDLVGHIFDSLHNPDYQDKMRWQVQKDLMGDIDNTPSIAFFGTPKNKDFEFIYTGHHVTRRCNAHTDKGLGFGGAPIFYGNFAKSFRETKDHPGNPYWYQGLILNEFVSALNGKEQKQILVNEPPRRERPKTVITRNKGDLPGLHCGDLSADVQAKLLQTMRRMLTCFREDDVEATMKVIEDKKMVNDLHIACYGGKYDIGGDGVWDTWQIEGPDLIWYFRGVPHIHAYFHLDA